jgi:hypothetical protein
MRTRMIKPGFWTNEQLAELSFETRLLFLGLTMIADKEGKLEDRPKRIGAEVFPFDKLDIVTMLDDLVRADLIMRYKLDDGKEFRRYIWIINFHKHQNPHIREVDSAIPFPADIKPPPIKVGGKKVGRNKPLMVEPDEETKPERRRQIIESVKCKHEELF